MKTRTLVAAAFAAVTLVGTTSAQTTATWIGGNTTNDYNFSTNWSTASAPNAIDSRAIFTSAASASWTNATNTLGSLLVSGGTLTLGNPSAATNVLVLDVSTGKPVISNANTVFMYADLQGNEGFTKLGGGDLSFRFNTRDLTYTGDIELLGGQLTVNQASSLGNSNNRLLVGSNSTFSVNNGANTGTYAFESTRTFVVSNGVTFSIRTGTNAIAAIFSNSIREAGTPGARIDFQGIAASSTNDATAFKYTLAGTSNNWSGRTTIQLGAKLTLASGTVISTNELNFSSGSGTWAGIDLGGNTQNVAHLGIGGSSTTARTFVISNGILRVTNPTAAFTFSGANGTLVDASNSTGFVFDGAGAGRNFIVRPDVTAGVNTTNTMILATAGAGSNTITAQDIIVGTASGTIGGTNHLAQLVLGKTNNLYANQLLIGGFNGAGAVQYAGGLSNPALVLRGSNGVSAMGNLIVGDTSSGVRPGSGFLDLSTGTIDAVIATNFIIARHAATNATPASIGTFSMSAGTLVAPTLVMAQKSAGNGSASPTLTANFNQGGGTVTITNITLGVGASAETPVLLPTYNLFGGTLFSTNISAGSGTFSSSSSRTLQFSNGGILRNLSGADLLVNGTATNSSSRINITLAGNGVVTADAGRTVTFGLNTRLAGAGTLTKIGTGTLILAASNDYTGTLDISNGVVLANNNRSLSATTTGTTVRSGAALEFSNTVTNNMNNTRISGTGIATNGAIRSIGGSNQFNRGIVLESDARIQADSGAALTISNFTAGSNAVSGTGFNLTVSGDGNTRITGTGGTNVIMTGVGGSLTKLGSGTLAVVGSNNYTGVTTVSGGALEHFAGQANSILSSEILINGGRFRLVGGGSDNNIAGTANLTMSSGEFIQDQFRSQNLTQLNMSGGVLTRTDDGIYQFGGAASLTGGAINLIGTNSVVRFNNTLALGGGNVVYSNAVNGTTNNVRVSSTVTYAATNTTTAWFTNAAAGVGQLQINAATNTFDIADSGSVASELNINWTVVGNALRKTGGGVLTLGGTTANTYSGNTVVEGGTLALNKFTNTAAIAGNLEVGTGAKLLISASEQVAGTSAVTLSGGTIERASGVNEVMGNLSVTASSFLEYGTGTAGNLEFGTYTPGAFKLTLNNFGLGNTLKFGSDLSAFIDTSFNGTSFSNAYFDINGMDGSPLGGFTSAWNGSTFTITSVPEPSTLLAALGLTGLMLWPARRRLTALIRQK